MRYHFYLRHEKSFLLLIKSKMSGGKGEIEDKLDKFIDKSYERFNLSRDDTMSKENARTLMKELMGKHKMGDAWDDAEFDRIFNLFEEDDPNDPAAADN
jgi:hypothetical protein